MLQALLMSYSFIPPSRWWMCCNYLPAVAGITRERIKEELTHSSPFVAITSDGWASRFAGSFESLTARTVLETPDGWIVREHRLDFKRLPEVAHTAPVLLQSIKDLCAEWNIKPTPLNPNASSVVMPVFTTTDSGLSLKKAIEGSSEFSHIPCFAHKMHRVMLSAVAKVPWLVNLLAKVLNISRNFNKSDKQKGAYMKFCRHVLGKVAKLPISPVQTRWDSFAEAATRYVEIHADICKYAGSSWASDAGAHIVQ